jgi:hypothetical protein
VRSIPRHQISFFDIVPEFVQSFVYSPLGFTDIHEKIFADGSYPVETWLVGDLPEVMFICRERNPRGPWKRGPICFKIFHLSTPEQMELSGLCGIDPHVLEDYSVLFSFGNKFENVAGIYFEGFYNFRGDSEIQRVASMMKAGLHGIFDFCHTSRMANAHLALNAHYVH